jgi:hypothetical protein
VQSLVLARDFLAPVWQSFDSDQVAEFSPVYLHRPQVKFAHGTHEGLSQDAVAVLIDLASKSTFDGLAESLTSATNLFDSATIIIS